MAEPVWVAVAGFLKFNDASQPQVVSDGNSFNFNALSIGEAANDHSRQGL